MKWTDGSKTIRRRKNDHKTIRRWIKWWTIRALLAAPLCPVAAVPLRRCCYYFAPYTSLAACERQKQRILPKAKGIRCAAWSFVYYAIDSPPFCQKAVFSIQSFFLRSARRQLNKQTKRIIRLNDSTFPFKRKRNETITLYCHIPYVLEDIEQASYCYWDSLGRSSTF